MKKRRRAKRNVIPKESPFLRRVHKLVDVNPGGACLCEKGGCRETGLYVAGYRNGSSGKWIGHILCYEHAEAFRRRHGLAKSEMPATIPLESDT